MASFHVLGESLWRNRRAGITLSTDALIYSQENSARRFLYTDIRKVQLTHHYDWRLRYFLRCRIHLAPRGHVEWYSASREASKRSIRSLFDQLLTRVAHHNPGLNVLHGMDHVKWFALAAGHVALAIAFLMLFYGAPREPIYSLAIGAIMAVYFFASVIAVVLNWPHYVSAVRTPETARGEAIHTYLAEQHERFVVPAFHLSAFALNPSSLAAEITSPEKKSFKLAIGGIWLAFLFFSVAMHLIVWAFSAKELHLSDTVQAEAALIAVPTCWLFLTFLILRALLGYEDIAPLRYLHASLYAVALFVIVEVLTMSAWIVFNFHFPQTQDVLEWAQCHNEPSHACIDGELRSHLRKNVGWGLAAIASGLWLVIIARFVQLTQIVFQISYLHAYLANISAWLLLFSLYLLLR